MAGFLDRGVGLAGLRLSAQGPDQIPLLMSHKEDAVRSVLLYRLFNKSVLQLRENSGEKKEATVVRSAHALYHGKKKLKIGSSLKVYAQTPDDKKNR
jgi:hypothetical protein